MTWSGGSNISLFRLALKVGSRLRSMLNARNTNVGLAAAGAAGALQPAGAAAAAGGAAAAGVAGGAAAIPPAVVQRPAVMPEAFDGTKDWAEYLQYFEQCGELNGWQNAQKARFLGVRLRDAAQRYYATLPAARKLNWAHVCADMEQRFAPDANVRQYKAQFKTRRRLAGESLAAVADDLRRLVASAYPRLGDAHQEELVRDQFVDALTPPALRMRLQENPPATAHEALEAALHLERIWENQETPVSPAMQLVASAKEVAATSPATVPRDHRLDDVVAGLEALESRLSRLETAMVHGNRAPAPEVRPYRPPNARGNPRNSYRANGRAGGNAPPRNTAGNWRQSPPGRQSGNGH